MQLTSEANVSASPHPLVHDVVALTPLTYLLDQWVHYPCGESRRGDEEACGAIHGDSKRFH